MNPSKSKLTEQTLKSKKDSESLVDKTKFRSSGGVAGGVLVPDTTGWDVQTSSEVAPDGRAFRTKTVAKTDGVEKIDGGRAEYTGRNEQTSSASQQGDDKNMVKKAAESSKTYLEEKKVTGDENSKRTEMKSSSVTSSSSKVSSSSHVTSGDDIGFDMEQIQLTPRHQKVPSEVNSTALHREQQQRLRNEQNKTFNQEDDMMNLVKNASDRSKPRLQENVMTGNEHSKRTQMKSSSVTSSSSKVVSSSSSTKVLSSEDVGFDLEQMQLKQGQDQYQKIPSKANSGQQQQQRNETTSNIREETRKYEGMDKSSPEYQEHVQYLMSQPGAIVSETVEYPKPGVKMITTIKKLPDGTTVKNKRYETMTTSNAGSTDDFTTNKDGQYTTAQRIDNDDNVSVSSDRTITSEKRTDAAHQAFARSLR